MPGRHQPGGPIHAGSEVVPVPLIGHAEVDSHSDAYCAQGRLGQCLLDVDRHKHGVKRALEYGGECITRGREDRAAVLLDHRSDDLIVAGERRTHRLGVGLPQPCRPLHVREQERHRAGRPSFLTLASSHATGEGLLLLGWERRSQSQGVMAKSRPSIERAVVEGLAHLNRVPQADVSSAPSLPDGVRPMRSEQVMPRPRHGVTAELANNSLTSAVSEGCRHVTVRDGPFAKALLSGTARYETTPVGTALGRFRSQWFRPWGFESPRPHICSERSPPGNDGPTDDRSRRPTSPSLSRRSPTLPATHRTPAATASSSLKRTIWNSSRRFPVSNASPAWRITSAGARPRSGAAGSISGCKHMQSTLGVRFDTQRPRCPGT